MVELCINHQGYKHNSRLQYMENIPYSGMGMKQRVSELEEKMKLIKLKEDVRFYYILVGDQLFDFNMTIPNDLRLSMPMESNEYLPIISEMLARKDLVSRHQERLLRSKPEDFRPFRRPFHPEEIDIPVRPVSFRDFSTFEDHVHNARRNKGLEKAKERYEFPAFYFSNISCITGSNESIRKPSDTGELDYELEAAVIIGKPGRNIPVSQAHSHIAGFTILNDWSARDIQRSEMKAGLGPVKGKDFATSIGPYLVTPDELEPYAAAVEGRGKQYSLTMTASVNGTEISRGNLANMHWTFAELVAHASRNTYLVPGDIIGSGVAGSGGIVEFPERTYPWLLPGDIVRLEIDKLGTLETRVEGSDE